jgi:DNA-binding TFAR19-related protein (PDSD5 family)
MDVDETNETNEEDYGDDDNVELPRKYSRVPTGQSEIRTAVDKTLAIDDLLTLILQFMTAHEKLTTIRMVCKDFNNAVCDATSWHSLRRQDFISADKHSCLEEILTPEAQPLLSQLRVIDLTHFDLPGVFDLRCTPYLESCALPMTDSMLTQAVTVLPRLTHLHLPNSSNISTDVAIDALIRMSKLRSLKWHQREALYDDRFAEAFGPSLQSLESYQGCMVAKMLHSFTLHCPPRLHSFCYDAVPTRSRDDPDVTKLLCRFLEIAGPGLTGDLVLDLQYCTPNPILCAVYKHCTRLKKLDVHACRPMESVFVDCLFGAVDSSNFEMPLDRQEQESAVHYPRLETLVIDSSYVSIPDCCNIARHCPNLTDLRLTGSMDNAGVFELARGLSNFQTFHFRVVEWIGETLPHDAVLYLASMCPKMRFLGVYVCDWGEYMAPPTPSTSETQDSVDLIRMRLNYPPFIYIRS